jgi:hypothetical protein
VIGSSAVECFCWTHCGVASMPCAAVSLNLFSQLDEGVNVNALVNLAD